MRWEVRLVDHYYAGRLARRWTRWGARRIRREIVRLNPTWAGRVRVRRLR